ncbi:MAG: hypothetical protein H6733_08315 [Alphaproteobacteria bacterium]|nr:hypothetical protein [Alphaproteobacteria bacterium]
MRLSPALLLGTLLAGCGGVQEYDFILDYNRLACEHELSCGDQAELVFDGILTVEACESANLDAVLDWGRGCKYRPASASECLFEMQGLICPGDGQLAERPPTCQTVYLDCVDVPDDTTDTTPGGQDTDASDTDAAQ